MTLFAKKKLQQLLARKTKNALLKKKKRVDNNVPPQGTSQGQKPGAKCFKNKKKLSTSELKQLAAVNQLKKDITTMKKASRLYSRAVLKGKIISTTGYTPHPQKYIIETSHLSKSYISGDLKTPVLKDLNVKIATGKIVAILGVSGSGKTTLLNLLSGLDKAEKGDIFVLGHNLSLLNDNALTLFRRRYIGFVFQQYNLLNNLNVIENAKIGENLVNKKQATHESALTVDEILDFIGLSDHKNKYPHQLSGGQQQRVSIARALSKQPAILFGDEPTGALDQKTGRVVLSLLRKINQELGTTVFLVTHNPQIAQMADVILKVKNNNIAEVIYNQNTKLPDEITVDDN